MDLLTGRTAIDWTKPIQRNGVPLHLIGRRANGDYFVDDDGACYTVKPNGDTLWNGYPVVNAPPPPAWPVKRWFVTCLEKVEDKVICSGQQHSEKEAKDIALRRASTGFRQVTVTEVSFNGPSGT